MDSLPVGYCKCHSAVCSRLVPVHTLIISLDPASFDHLTNVEKLTSCKSCGDINWEHGTSTSPITTAVTGSRKSNIGNVRATANPSCKRFSICNLIQELEVLTATCSVLRSARCGLTLLSVVAPWCCIFWNVVRFATAPCIICV